MEDPAPAGPEPARITPATDLISMLTSGRFSDTKLVFKLVEAIPGHDLPDASSGASSDADVVGAGQPGTGSSRAGAAKCPPQATPAPSSALAQADLTSCSGTCSFDAHAVILAGFSEYFSRRLDEEAAGWRTDGPPPSKRKRLGADGAPESTSHLPGESAVAATTSETGRPPQSAALAPQSEQQITTAGRTTMPAPPSTPAPTSAPAPTLAPTSTPTPAPAPAPTQSEAEAAPAPEPGVVLAPGQRLLIERLEDPSDLPAAEQLVRFIYHQVLPEEVTQDPGLLCKVAQLADRYQVPTCITAATQALGQVKPDQLEVQHIDQVLCLSDNLLRHPGCKVLLEVCVERIQQLFGDTPQTIRTPSEREAFLNLPFEVVKLWAGADGLAVSSENDVVVLLSVWCNANKETVTYEQRQQLSGLVRLRHLTQSYLLSVLPRLDWFVADAQMLRYINTLAATSSTPGHVWRYLSTIQVNNAFMPSGWTAEPRTGTLVYSSGRFFQVFYSTDVTLAEAVSEAQRGRTGRPGEPTSMYMAGYMFELTVEFKPSSDSTFLLTCELTVRPEALRAAATASKASGAGWVVLFYGELDVWSSLEDDDTIETLHNVMLEEDPLWTCTLISGLTSLEDLQQHMRDDELVICCTICKVC